GIEPLPGLRVDEMDRGVDGHMVKYASGPRAGPAPSTRPDNVAVVAQRRERIVDQMANDERHPRADRAGIVELTRVQPIEAEVIAARLRAAGIPATVPADSVYPSLTFANGVPVYVPAQDAARAEALLQETEEDEAD